MIARVSGRLAAKTIDRVELMTAGGVGYEIVIPLAVLESLPKLGDEVTLHTALVVKEDGWQLYGFGSAHDRSLFHTLRGASGVGPALALGLISSLGSARVVRAIRDRDLATLQGVPRVGKKVAERLCVELGDKMKDFAGADAGAPGPGRPEGVAADSIRALVSLGYATSDAETAVRSAVESGGAKSAASDVIRAALAVLQKR